MKILPVVEENMDDEMQFRKNLILASALFHSEPPTDCIRASSARVLKHALRAAGLWDKQLQENASAVFTGDSETLARFPVVGQWYATLIQLTFHEPESERLLKGGGNLILPAAAFFTACWLTSAGQLVAERLLAEHPEWRNRLTASDV